jgi:excisionase family DNA binding protein
VREEVSSLAHPLKTARLLAKERLLIQKKSEPVTRSLINVEEAAAYLDLSPHTLYTMVSQRRVPFVKVGRLVKFDLDLLDKWIKQNTVMPMPSKSA